MDFFSHITLLSALAVVLIQQILKLNVVPSVFANKYPVLTNILLSIVTSIVEVWRTSVQPHAWTDWILLVATTSVVAAITYNATIRNWNQLREMESKV